MAARAAPRPRASGEPVHGEAPAQPKLTSPDARLRALEVVLIRTTTSILLAALLAVPALALTIPTAAAAGPVDNCVLLYELADVRRHYLCVDPKADCPVYTKTVGWTGTTTDCVLPEARSASTDCGAACVEDCRLVVTAVGVAGGCTIRHQPYYFESACLVSDCSWLVIGCDTDYWGLCEMHESGGVAHCQMLVGGFELDTYLCVDTEAECKAWIDYRWTPYCLTPSAA